MQALHIAVSLVRIPRLFISLLLGPLLIGLIFVFAQSLMISAYLVADMPKTMEDLNENMAIQKDISFFRYLLYNKTEKLNDLKICRWLNVDKSPCMIEEHDIAIITENPQTLNIDKYVDLFNGSTKQLHICSNCKTDINIDLKSNQIYTDIINPVSILVLFESQHQNSDISQNLFEIATQRLNMQDTLGEISVYPVGLNQPIKFSTIEDDILIAMNISMYLVVILWLALRSHRKVLDYFSKSGALLPLVSACSKQSFYGAIWIITLIRVLLFIASTAPLSIIILYRLIKNDMLITSIDFNSPTFILWIICLLASLATITLIGSIAELKHRQGWTSMFYKIAPVFCALLGAGFWISSLFSNIDALITTRHIIEATPGFGLLPIIAAPICGISSGQIVLHTVLCSALITIVLLINARWFAAHLEEL